eukprot:TRINITY_DN4368_c0_g1_i1.p2 TRINITY_DN4368_c0_g1~~TRINITY_DN4368_c0_g1_i1.p2  ORF type:complete len:126 (-),score=19.26 TRINITY_DN4368_c0_g1_i1:665-1042(-)
MDYVGIKYQVAHPILDALDGILNLRTSSSSAASIASKLHQTVILKFLRKASEEGKYSTTMALLPGNLLKDGISIGPWKRFRRARKLYSLLRRQLSVITSVRIVNKTRTTYEVIVKADWRRVGKIV